MGGQGDLKGVKRGWGKWGPLDELGVFAPVHPCQGRRRARGEKRDDLLILHRPHLLGSDQRPETVNELSKWGRFEH
jgi:hypothetical protein